MIRRIAYAIYAPRVRRIRRVPPIGPARAPRAILGTNACSRVLTQPRALSIAENTKPRPTASLARQLTFVSRKRRNKYAERAS